MAGILTQITTKDDSVNFGDGVSVEIPIADLMAVAPGEAATQGFTLWNENRRVRVSDILNADGLPIEFTVQLRAYRSPATADEMERHEAAMALKAGKTLARKTEDQEKREREIDAAARHTRNAFSEALKVSAATSDIAAKVKESLALAQVLRGAMQKVIE